MDNASLKKENLAKTRCERKVVKNKYEENAPEIRNWWYQLFEILEADAAIKPHKRLKLLKEIFPTRIIQKIESILTLEEEKFKDEVSLPPTEGFHFSRRKKKTGSEKSPIPDSERPIIDLEELEQRARDLQSKSSSTMKRRFGDSSRHKDNPYLNFFKRRPDRAAIWRELPPLSLQDMNLNQKADAIARAIATDFVEWIKTLGGDQETKINVQSMMEMFEIASQNDSTTSVRVQLKEMPSVSPKVAEYMRVPHMSRTVMLEREIKRDKLATKRKQRIVAFGRRLPTEMQVRPLDAKQYRKWHSCETVPEKIASMAAVWQGITHLKSTKAFCEFLFNEKCDVKPPKFLIDSGMMDPKSFSTKKDSGEFEADSFGDVSRSLFQ